MEFSQAWPLLLVTVLAALLPGVSRILKLPAVVLEIICGVVLGQSILNLQFGGEWLGFLAQLGFLILMFQAGMEIDFGMLRRLRGGEWGVHLAVFLTTVGLALAGALTLGQGIFLALVLSTTSLGLVVPTLRDAGLNRTRLGQTALISATLADFLTLLAITFFLLWHDQGLTWQFLWPIPLFAGFGILLKLARLWAWWFPERVGRLLDPQDNQELGMRLSLALLFFFVALSELVHLEPVLGAFMGGALISFVFKEKGGLETKISGLGYGFLIPLFFIHVGMNFDLNNLLNWEQMLFTVKLLGLALLVKLLPSLLFVLNRISAYESLKLGFLLSSRLSLIVVAASIGYEAGFITAVYKDSIILLAVCTCLIGPTLFKILYSLTRHELRV
ncbi:MAG: cation:proton antiporter [Desulfovermiculus sp.]